GQVHESVGRVVAGLLQAALADLVYLLDDAVADRIDHGNEAVSAVGDVHLLIPGVVIHLVRAHPATGVDVGENLAGLEIDDRDGAVVVAREQLVLVPGESDAGGRAPPRGVGRKGAGGGGGAVHDVPSGGGAVGREGGVGLLVDDHDVDGSRLGGDGGIPHVGEPARRQRRRGC